MVPTNLCTSVEWASTKIGDIVGQQYEHMWYLLYKSNCFFNSFMNLIVIIVHLKFICFGVLKHVALHACTCLKCYCFQLFFKCWKHDSQKHILLQWLLTLSYITSGTFWKGTTSKMAAVYPNHQRTITKNKHFRTGNRGLLICIFVHLYKISGY